MKVKKQTYFLTIFKLKKKQKKDFVFRDIDIVCEFSFRNIFFLSVPGEPSFLKLFIPEVSLYFISVDIKLIRPIRPAGQAEPQGQQNECCSGSGEQSYKEWTGETGLETDPCEVLLLLLNLPELIFRPVPEPRGRELVPGK